MEKDITKLTEKEIQDVFLGRETKYKEYFDSLDNESKVGLELSYLCDNLIKIAKMMNTKNSDEIKIANEMMMLFQDNLLDLVSQKKDSIKDLELGARYSLLIKNINKNKIKHEKLLNEFSNDLEKETENIIIDDDILKVRTKLLLLKELGVIKVLRGLPLNDSQFAQLITEIIETDKTRKKNTFDTVRKDLRYIEYDKGKNEYSPITKGAISKVNAILIKYNLPVIKGI